MPPVKDDSIAETNCLEIINIVEKSPAKSTLVDVRACNKPAAKVRIPQTFHLDYKFSYY